MDIFKKNFQFEKCNAPNHQCSKLSKFLFTQFALKNKGKHKTKFWTFYWRVRTLGGGGLWLGHRRALCDEFVVLTNINHNEWCVDILPQVVVPRLIYNFFMLSNCGILLVVIIYSSTWMVPQFF